MDIENLTPEQIQLILASGEDDPAYAESDNKERIANAMRQKAMNPARGGMVGQVFVGATPLEHMANAYGGYKGNQMQGEADTMRRGAHDRSVQGRGAYGQALAAAMRKKAAAPQTPPTSYAIPGDDIGPGVPLGGV